MPKSTIPAADSGLSDESHREIDPVFAAIEEHKRCDAAVEERPDDNDAVDAACDRARAAAWALAETVPTTAAGISAMIAYFTQDDFEQVTELPNILETYMRSIASSPVLADKADSLLCVEDDLDRTKDLVTAAFMAAADLPDCQGGPMQTLLDLVEEQMEELGERLNAIRRADPTSA